MEEDREVPGDRRTFEVIKEIGDSLEDMIQLTADVPSNYSNGRVPILDMEVWIEKDEEGVSQLRWSFYEKKMKNKFVTKIWWLRDLHQGAGITRRRIRWRLERNMWRRTKRYQGTDGLLRLLRRLETA